VGLSVSSLAVPLMPQLALRVWAVLSI